jgi:hypothetical protein
MNQMQETGEFTFFSGKFKGQSINQVGQENPDYIRWCSKEHPAPKVRQACEAWLTMQGEPAVVAAGPVSRPAPRPEKLASADLAALNEKLDWIISKLS